MPLKLFPGGEEGAMVCIIRARPLSAAPFFCSHCRAAARLETGQHCPPATIKHRELAENRVFERKSCNHTEYVILVNLIK